MASDLILVLGSQHRRLAQVLERSQRGGRGLSDPAAELRRETSAHVAAAASEIVPLLGRKAPAALQAWVDGVEEVAELAGAGELALLQDATEDLVRTEQAELIPWLERTLSLDERRRAGKLYRARRDLQARTPAVRRQRSRTELYELARRAGVENRSRMTQAELRAAVEAWEQTSEGLRLPAAGSGS